MDLRHDITGTAISIDESERMLMEIMNGLDAINTKAGNGIQRTVSDRFTVGIPTKSEGGLCYHVFNFEDDNGFAIMSGDRRVTPLLALALDGSLHEGDTIDNPGLAMYLSKLGSYFENTIVRDSLEFVDSLSVVFPGEGNRVYEDTEMEAGHCQVKWFQTYPYNYLCYGTDGERIPVGSSTVAMAQLMSIYKYPHTLDWDGMIEVSTGIRPDGDDSYSKMNTFPEGPITPGVLGPKLVEIAQLMKMTRDLLEGGNPEDIDKIPSALEDFGYSSGGELISYEHGGSRENEAIEELKSGHYVIMVGRESFKVADAGNTVYYNTNTVNTVERNSHSWLVHGLLTETTTIYEGIRPYVFKCYYFLCNYGWGGEADGYYLSDVFDTENGPKLPDPETKSVEDMVDDGNYNDTFSMKYIIGIRK